MCKCRAIAKKVKIQELVGWKYAYPYLSMFRILKMELRYSKQWRLNLRMTFVVSFFNFPLLVAQRHHRIDARGAAGGDVTGEEGYEGEHNRDGNERQWVPGVNTVEKLRQKL